MEEYQAALDERPQARVTKLSFGWLKWVALVGVIGLGGLAWYAKDHLTWGKPHEPTAAIAGQDGRPHLRFSPEPLTVTPEPATVVSNGMPVAQAPASQMTSPAPAKPGPTVIKPTAVPPKAEAKPAAPHVPGKRYALLSSPRMRSPAGAADISGGLTLATGTVMNCANINAINSDVGGEIKALVTMTVKDTATMRIVLIPQYASVVVRYGDRAVRYGERRLRLAVDTRLVIGDREYPMQAHGQDALGVTGWTGEVDTHFWQNVGAVIIQSVLKGSAQSVVSMGSAVSGPGGETVTGAVGKTVAQDGSQSVKQQIEPWINTSPTITIPGAQRCALQLAEPLILPPYTGGTLHAGR